MLPPTLKCQLIFNGLHDVTSHKTELFITTTVRTSNPTFAYFIDNIHSYFKASNIYHSHQGSQTNFVCNKMKTYIICAHFPLVEKAKYIMKS
jgi:hypothetical protein